MKVAVIYNKDFSGVINPFGMQNKEHYRPETIEKIASGLEKGGHEVRIIDGNIHLGEELRHFIPKGRKNEITGLAFNMALGIQGQARYTHIPAMLEMYGVPYTGSGPAAHGIALDKVISKLMFRYHQLPTPDFWLFESPEAVKEGLPYPLIVKPKLEAVSFGLRVVNSKAELQDAVHYITEEFEQAALAELFIPGQEFSVSIIGNEQAEALPVVGYDFQGDINAIQTNENKTTRPFKKICPARIPKSLEEELKRLAIGAFHAVGLSDYTRVDFRVNPQGEIYILEVNSMASLGVSASYVMAAQAAGYDYSALVNKILAVACQRYVDGFKRQQGIFKDDKAPFIEALDKYLANYLKNHATAIAYYLRPMIEMNAWQENPAGVNAFGEWVSGHLSDLGFQLTRYPQSPGGDIFYFTNHPEPLHEVLIVGNLDTSYPIDPIIPLREDKGQFYGYGVAENKGAIAELIGSLQALRFSRILKRVKCGILLVSDKNQGCPVSRNKIKEVAQLSKCVIGITSGDLNNGLATPNSPPGNELYAKVQQIATQMNLPITQTRLPGDSPIRLVPAEIPALDGLGPVGHTSHSPEEYILRDSLVYRATLLALLMETCIAKP